jgi:hypothetical protein
MGQTMRTRRDCCGIEGASKQEKNTTEPKQFVKGWKTSGKGNVAGGKIS